MSDDLADIVLAVDGCGPAWQWAQTLPDGTTVEQAWNTCPDASWLFWIVSKCSGYQGSKIRLAMASCSRTVLPIIPDGPKKDACIRYLDSVERDIKAHSENSANVLRQDAMEMWDIELGAPWCEAVAYEIVQLAESVSYEDMLILAESALDLRYSKLLALMADCVRVALPWDAVELDILALIATSGQKGPGT